MKQTVSIFAALMIAAASFAGCNNNLPPNSSSSAPEAASSVPSSSATGSAPTAQGALKTGFAVVTAITDSKDAGAEDGLAKSDSTVVAVTVDETGRIVSCIIDGVQTSINFSKEGKVLTALDTQPKTKNEMGTEYGLGKVSGIGKEWNQQAEAFASYVTGKTVDEVNGIAVTEEGKPADAELSSSVTIYIGGFVKAIEKAVDHAQHLGAHTGDKLGLGIVTNIDKSVGAGEKEGLAQADSTYAAVTFDADGKISSCYLDGSQSNVNFDKAGKITTDLKTEQKTKNELGDAYGMKSASSIGKEWYEQAAAYAAYAVGKTFDEIKGVAVNEKGAPTDAELSSSVTISVGNFNRVIEKASANTK